MTTDQLAELKRNLEQAEGRIPHMYLDSARPAWVTCGVGHRLTTVGAALALPFEPAAEIAADFARVSAARPGQMASAYEPLCQSRLSEAAIDELLERDVATKLGEVERCLPSLPTWPSAAQLAVVDMAFNLGTRGLIHKFPKLVTALDRRDWLTCSRECERGGVSASRNQRTADLFREAA